jgi:phosphoserine phosphatase
VAIRLVAFDLDGTLIRGYNALAVVGIAHGHPEWEKRMEILSMRGMSPAAMTERMAPWQGYSKGDLCGALAQSRFAPGVDEAFALLHGRGVTTAICSLGWDFLVEWFAARFGATHWAASRLGPDGAVTPLWPEDKGPWLERLAAELGLSRQEIAAVGDSPRDASLLRTAGHAFYVGADKPEAPHPVRCYPDGDLAVVARAILQL